MNALDGQIALVNRQHARQELATEGPAQVFRCRITPVAAEP